jgi:AAA-like domain/CHAT domain
VKVEILFCKNTLYRGLTLAEGNLTRILFLASDPSDLSRLRLGQELRDIREKLQLSKQRDVFLLESRESVRPSDVTQAIFDFSPQVIHFSGHGTEEGYICFENIEGKVQPVSPNALAALFSLVSDQIKCVVLNACYSEIQAKAISEHIPFVIGMNKAIGDKAAILFSTGFYKALGAGHIVENAYKFGCVEIQLNGIQEHLIPVIHTQKSQDKISSPALSTFYIDRPPFESECYEAITKPAALIRIKAPWQMGKTSLMMKILDFSVQQGDRAVRLSFQAADTEVFDSINHLLKWICVATARSLNLEDKLASYWEEDFLGSKDLCSVYFEEYLLPAVDNALVLGLDETDLLFQKTEVGLDFLGLIRSWHEKGKMDRMWQKLRLVIAYSFEDHTRISMNQSPFNAGWPIELPPFNALQVKELAQRYGVRWSKKQLEQVMEIINGHPYLLQKSLKSISIGRITLSDLLKFSHTDLGIFKDHLNHFSMLLESYPELKLVMKQVAESDIPVKLESSKVFQLKNLGLVKSQGNEVMPACRLYRDYFREHL